VFPELEEHYQLLRRWNKVLNLTSIDNYEEAVERHYGESLFLGQHLPPGHLTIADIGSGAGFPGIPVAVLRPDCTVTLIEAHQRKAVFLREATRKLPNIRILAKRVEDVTESFAWVVSRAVSYEDLGKNLKRLGRRAALLTGAEPPPESLGFEWETPIPLPAGRQRFLRVSRETSSNA
jgi:16S rRNA (guanine527-N7)-methyltransferase